MFLFHIVPGSLDVHEAIELVLLEGVKGSSTEYSAVQMARRQDAWGLCVYHLIHVHLLCSVF